MKTWFNKTALGKVAVAAIAGVSVFALSACGGTATTPNSSSAPGAATDSITVYNAQHESLTQAWADAFTKETGIKVTLRNGGDTELGNQIVAGRRDLAGRRVPDRELARPWRWSRTPGCSRPSTPTRWRRCPTTSGRPTATGSASPRAAPSSPTTRPSSRADQLPKSLLDLADPSWKGRWAASPSGADFQAIVSALLELKGEAATADWLKAMKENVTAYKGNSTAMKAVNAGEIDGARDLPLLLVRRPGQDRREQQERRAALLQEPGPGRLRQHLRRRRAGLEQAPEGGPGLPEMDHRQGRPGHPADRQLLRIRGRHRRAASNPKLVPLADLQAPKVDPSKLNTQKVTDLMTEAGLL